VPAKSIVSENCDNRIAKYETIVRNANGDDARTHYALRNDRTAYAGVTLSSIGGSVAIRRCGMIRANEANGMTDEADLDSGLGPQI
jgi:hypothetical protein